MAEEVECEFCVGDEKVPSGLGERRVDAGKDGDEVVLEGADGPFGGVPSMHVRWYKLVLHVPGPGNSALAFGAGFIVEDLEVDRVSACLESSHDGVVGCKVMTVVLGLEWAARMALLSTW